MIQGRFKTRLILIDEDTKAREGLGYVIESNSRCILLNSYASCEEAIRFIHKDAPDLIVMDLVFSGIEGIDAIKRIREMRPQAEFLVVTRERHTELFFAAIAAGVTGYVLKESGLSAFLSALDEILSGGAYLSAVFTRTLLESFWVNPISPLSDRETEVLKLVTEGKSYTQIAAQLNISQETAKTHIKNIYKKLKVGTKSEAVKKAIHDKLVSRN
jgi:DNA-binding NarL/FixJ family response regulator